MAIWAGYLMGAVALLAGIGHWVAVTIVAFGERGGYDVRLATLLAVGFLPVACGGMMLWGASRVAADPEAGLQAIAVASGLFSAVIVVLWPALVAPPNGSLWGTAVGLAGFLAAAALAWSAL